MIQFRALMQAIQQSIHNAAQAVEAQGLKHIDDFFDKIDVKDKNGNVVGKRHRPKMVTMEFPSRTPNGVETMTANVPLIALSPISTPKIAEVKFAAKLEVSTDEQDNVMVSFPTSHKKSMFSRSDDLSNGANTKIEITLKGEEPPEGLQKVIEGYEKALRAQIPG